MDYKKKYKKHHDSAATENDEKTIIVPHPNIMGV